MTAPFTRLPRLAAALAILALTALPAWAQGTEEQQEACAPDAVKLCQDTIPDIPKTTACMKAHFAELSPRCKVAFNAVTGDGGKPGRRGARREEAAPPSAAPPPPVAAPAETPAAETIPGTRSYEAHIREICREGLVDAFTCRNTLDLLKAGE